MTSLENLLPSLVRVTGVPGVIGDDKQVELFERSWNVGSIIQMSSLFGGAVCAAAKASDSAARLPSFSVCSELKGSLFRAKYESESKSFAEVFTVFSMVNVGLQSQSWWKQCGVSTFQVWPS